MNEEQPARLTSKQIEQIARDEASGKPVQSNLNDISERAEEQYREALRENAPYLTLGMQMAMTIALGAGIGWWIDRQTGTSLWLGVGAGIGAVLGMGYFILVVLRMDKTTTQSSKHKY